MCEASEGTLEVMEGWEARGIALHGREKGKSILYWEGGLSARIIALLEDDNVDKKISKQRSSPLRSKPMVLTHWQTKSDRLGNLEQFQAQNGILQHSFILPQDLPPFLTL